MIRLIEALRSRTFAYTIAFCLVIVGLGVWPDVNSRGEEIAQVEKDMVNLARSLRQHADDTLQMGELAIANLVELFETEGVNEDTAVRARAMMTASLAAQDRLHHLSIFRADGSGLVNSTTVADGQNVSDRDYFKHHQAIDDGKSYLGPPIVERLSGEWALTVSRRIDDAQGRFAGVALATIASGYFADHYRQFEIGRRGSIVLASSIGTVLSRIPYNRDAIGIQLGHTKLLGAELKSEPSGSLRYVSPIDGVERIGGYDSSERHEIVVLTAVSQEEVLAPWMNGVIQRQIVIGLLVILTAVLGLKLAMQRNRRRHDALAMRQKEAEFRLLAESASDLVERFDINGIRRYVSPAVERISGFTPDELLGTSAYDRINEADQSTVREAAQRLRAGLSSYETVSYRVHHKDGRELWLETSFRITPGDEHHEPGIVSGTRDITDRKHLQLRLAAMATIDGLTELSNRRAFDQALQDETARCHRSEAPLSLVLVDVDRFKLYNDQYGHLAGDTCLKSIAAVIMKVARRPNDIAARYGGEEMVLLLPDTNLSGATFIAGELCRQIEALRIPHELNLPWQVVTVSAGVSSIEFRPGEPERDGNWLISTADMALYQAKGEGRNRAKAAPREITEFEREAG